MTPNLISSNFVGGSQKRNDLATSPIYTECKSELGKY